jgi:pilus assembly protein Flp/PilA
MKGGKPMLRIQAELYQVWARIRDRFEREEGQALVEYALILALIAVVTIAVLQLIGVNVSKILNKVSSSLSSVAGP